MGGRAMIEGPGCSLFILRAELYQKMDGNIFLTRRTKPSQFARVWLVLTNLEKSPEVANCVASNEIPKNCGHFGYRISNDDTSVVRFRATVIECRIK